MGIADRIAREELSALEAEGLLRSLETQTSPPGATVAHRALEAGARFATVWLSEDLDPVGWAAPTSEAVTPDPGFVRGLPYAGSTPGNEGEGGDNSSVAVTPGRHSSNRRGILAPVAGGAILFLGALHLRILKRRLAFVRFGSASSALQPPSAHGRFGLSMPSWPSPESNWGCAFSRKGTDHPRAQSDRARGTDSFSGRLASSFGPEPSGPSTWPIAFETSTC